jgi:hypothetical protein
MFHDAGIPIPRLAYATVILNTRPLGLYIVKEGFTRNFIRRHFDHGEGNLYDNDDGFDVDQPMDRDLAEDAIDSQSDLKRLTAAALEPDLDQRWNKLRQALDMDQFLRFMAVEMMIGHWDGYCLGQNNFRLYHDPVCDRMIFLPSGMDQIFAKADLPWQPPMMGLIARALMETPDGAEAYQIQFRRLFKEVFVLESLHEEIKAHLEILQRSISLPVFLGLREHATELRTQIAARRFELQKQLAEPSARIQVFTHGQAFLDQWEAFDTPQRGRLVQDVSSSTGPILRIIAEDRTAASWRTRLILPQGHYRFQGRARTTAVEPLPFGSRQGACLRVLGHPGTSAELTGTIEWKQLELEFDVAAPEAEVVLMCELRAGKGEVWFDRSSLGLMRLP